MNVNQHQVGTCQNANGIKLSLVTRDCSKSSLGIRAFKGAVAQDSPKRLVSR